MVSAFERLAVQRVIDKARDMGLDVPPTITQIVCSDGPSNNGAVLWHRAHPDDDGTGCCYGDAHKGPDGCTCWVPIYDVDQADPIEPTNPSDIQVQARMCGDCAYRKDSPERSKPYEEEALLSLADEGQPFYCHDGMRRPVRWEHPDGRAIAGSSDDWRPAMVNGLPYRANGLPGLLCAGWAARAARADGES